MVSVKRFKKRSRKVPPPQDFEALIEAKPEFFEVEIPWHTVKLLRGGAAYVGHNNRRLSKEVIALIKCRERFTDFEDRIRKLEAQLKTSNSALEASRAAQTAEHINVRDLTNENVWLRQLIDRLTTHLQMAHIAYQG